MNNNMDLFHKENLEEQNNIDFKKHWNFLLLFKDYPKVKILFDTSHTWDNKFIQKNH